MGWRPKQQTMNPTRADLSFLTAHDMQTADQNIAAQEVAALLSIHAQREPSSRFQNIIVQAPEDSKDVVAAAKRVLNQSDVNALGLRDQRDMTRLIAQSALQVRPDRPRECSCVLPIISPWIGVFSLKARQTTVHLRSTEAVCVYFQCNLRITFHTRECIRVVLIFLALLHCTQTIPLFLAPLE